MSEDGVISTRQAAEQLGVSVRTVQLWVEAGELKAWKTAGMIPSGSVASRSARRSTSS